MNFGRRNLSTQQRKIAEQRDRENEIAKEASAKKKYQIENKMKSPEERNGSPGKSLYYTLGTKDVAKILGININKVRDLIDKNQLVAIKAGRFWRVNEESVKKYKNKQND